MRDHRLVISVDHPVRGHVIRFRLPRAAPHALLAGAGILLIALVGAVASNLRFASENQRLALRETVLQQEYDRLSTTLDERDTQLDSLSTLAHQISIAYGFSRDESAIESARGPEPTLAYHSSLDQYDILRASGPSEPAHAQRANAVPSIWPVKGHISSSYGNRSDPFNGKGTFHRGVDLSAPYGSPVVASGDGYVVSAEWDGALGHRVKIAHGRSGYHTIYGHLKEYYVRRGDRVLRGELIGQVGSTGRTTGKHLHYEVHYRGTNVNPYRYLVPRDRRYATSLAD